MIVLGAGLQRLGGFEECGAGLLVPGEVGGLFGPEGLGVVKRVVLDFVLGVGWHPGLARGKQLYLRNGKQGGRDLLCCT